MLESVDNLCVSHASIKPIDLISVHFDEALLRLDILIGFRVKKNGLHQLEEAVWVEGEEPAQELLISRKPHDIVNIDPPLKSA